MAVMLFGRFSLNYTFVTYQVPGFGTSGFCRVDSINTSPPIPDGKGHNYWARLATPSELFEFGRQEDAIARAAGVPANLRRCADLWKYQMDDPAREAHRLRLVEANPALGVFPYPACM